MDNCDLQHLRITPAQLKPKFQPNITEYESTVTSDVDKVKFDCLTSDSGASYHVIVSILFIFELSLINKNHIVYKRKALFEIKVIIISNL